MKRQLLRGIICVSAAIALSGCSSKADVKDNDNSTESTMVDVTTEETTKGMNENKESESSTEEDTTVDGMTEPVYSGISSIAGGWDTISDDNDWITYVKDVGFINKQGDCFNPELIESRKDVIFNESIFVGNYEADYSMAAIYVMQGQNGYELYYIDKKIAPVLLTDNCSFNHTLYRESANVDISVNGRSVLYCTPSGTDSVGMDLYLYNADYDTNIYIDTDVMRAYFTVDSDYIVYVKQDAGIKEASISAALSDEGKESQYIIYDVNGMEKLTSFKTSMYLDKAMRGYIEVNDNGDIVMFMGLNRTAYENIEDSGILLFRNEEAYSLYSSDEKYYIIANREENEMFIITDSDMYYLDTDNMKLTELGSDYYGLLVPYIYAGYAFGYSCDTFDKTILAAMDGVYVFDKASYSVKKIANADDVYNGYIWNDGSVVYIDNNGIYMVEGDTSQPVVTTLYEADMSNVSAFTAAPENDAIYLENSSDGSVIEVKTDGTGIHKLGEGDLFTGHKYDYTYMVLSGRFMYDSSKNDGIYCVDDNFIDSENIMDGHNVTVLNEINDWNSYSYFDYTVWPVYHKTDNSIYMYNGEENIKIR